MNKIRRNLNYSPILGDIYDVIEKRPRDEAVTIIDGLFAGHKVEFAARELQLVIAEGSTGTQVIERIVDWVRLESARHIVLIDDNCPCCVALAQDLLESPEQIDDVLRVKEDEDACDCGGTYDEDDKCSDCSNGHDDCELNECQPCMERAADRAEWEADAARDREMGL